MFYKGTLMSLNTFLTFIWYYVHFSDPESHSEVMRSSKMAYSGPLNPYKEELLKNVIFCDFVKLLPGALRWLRRYVEMFLETLEGVLRPRIHFRCVSEPQ